MSIDYHRGMYKAKGVCFPSPFEGQLKHLLLHLGIATLTFVQMPKKGTQFLSSEILYSVGESKGTSKPDFTATNLFNICTAWALQPLGLELPGLNL